MVDNSILKCETIKLKQFFCFFLLIPTLVFSQLKIEGNIKDENNIVIDGANIILKNAINNKTIAYTISDKGCFKLQAEKGSYILKISYLGYKTFIKNTELIDVNLKLDTIILIENTTELEEVIVKAENNGIIQKGDVTQYKIEKFLNGTEENLKDIITKLPGLGINENGKITANGKEIDRLLIDGENLYKRQHQLATENINSEMVKNAELIRNYKDFESINQGDKSGTTALNINIKDEYKNKFTGNIETHAGIKNRYKINGSLFNFNKKIKFSLITNSNNLGESTISIQDYYALTDSDAMSNTNEESKVIFSKLENLPKFLSSNNRVKSINTNFASLSSIVNFSEKVKLDFYSIFNNNNQKELNNRKLIFTNNSNVFNTNENNIIRETNYFGVMQLKSIFKPNQNTVLTLNNHLSIDNTDQLKNIVSVTDLNTNNITENNKPEQINFNSELIFNKKIKSNLLQSSLSFNLEKSNNDYFINSDLTFLNINFNNNVHNVNQQIRKLLRKTSYNIDYTINNKYLTVNLFNNTSIGNNDFNSNTNNLLDFSNQLSLNQFLSKNGVNLNFNLSKKIHYTIGINHTLIYNSLNNDKNNSGFLGVNTSIKSVFNTNNIADLSYNYSNSIASIDYLANGFLIKDYRNLIQNQDVVFDDLFPFHQISASHFIFKPKSKFSYIFNASYNIKEKSIGNNIINFENFTISKNKIIDKENLFRAFVFWDKQFKKIPFSFSGSTSYSNNEVNYFQDNFTNNFINQNFSTVIKLRSQFKNSFIHIDVGYKYSKDNFKDNSNTSSLKIYQPHININGQLKKHFFWQINTKYTKFDNVNISREVFNISPSLRYSKEKSKWQIYLTGNNILNLNNREIIEANNAPSFREQKTTSILEGYLLIGTKFKF